jgi:NitT/TauT family transport system substrate-binding protein
MLLRCSIGAALVVAIATAGCGDEAAGSGERTRLTVALVPIHEVAPVHLGIEKGFFEAEVLEVEALSSRAACAASRVNEQDA